MTVLVLVLEKERDCLTVGVLPLAVSATNNSQHSTKVERAKEFDTGYPNTVKTNIIATRVILARHLERT